MPGISDEMRDKWKGRVAFCQRHTDKLDKWSLGFVDSIEKQLENNKDLSLKQSYKLGQIYHDVADGL